MIEWFINGEQKPIKLKLDADKQKKFKLDIPRPMLWTDWEAVSVCSLDDGCQSMNRLERENYLRGKRNK